MALVELNDRELYLLVAALETEKRAQNEYYKLVANGSDVHETAIAELVLLRNKIRDAKA